VELKIESHDIQLFGFTGTPILAENANGENHSQLIW
jgi:type I site-specific restriction-modification system R (restriction) subunit